METWSRRQTSVPLLLRCDSGLAALGLTSTTASIGRDLPHWGIFLAIGSLWSLSALCWLDWRGISTIAVWTACELWRSLSSSLRILPWFWWLYRASLLPGLEHRLLLLFPLLLPSSRTQLVLSMVIHIGHISRLSAKSHWVKSAFCHRPICSTQKGLRLPLLLCHSCQWLWKV